MNLHKEDKELFNIIKETIEAVKGDNTIERLMSDASDKLGIDIDLIEDTIKHNNYIYKGNK